MTTIFGIAAVLVVGCGSSSTLDRAGVRFNPPEGWTVVPAGGVVVPGTPLAAWSGPGGGSIVLVRSLPIPSPDARGLAAELATRWENLPGVRVASAGAAEAGLPAARVELIGPGTGDALAPSGMGKPLGPPGEALVETRRLVLSIPRRADTITMVAHYPESARDTIGPQVEAAARSLVVADLARARQSY